MRWSASRDLGVVDTSKWSFPIHRNVCFVLDAQVPVGAVGVPGGQLSWDVQEDLFLSAVEVGGLFEMMVTYENPLMQKSPQTQNSNLHPLSI